MPQPEPYAVRPATVAPGLRVAACRLCRWTSMPLSGENAVRVAVQHLHREHAHDFTCECHECREAAYLSRFDREVADND